MVVIAARRVCLALIVILLGACTAGDAVDREKAADPEPTATAAPASWMKASCKSPRRHIELIKRGYYPGRSPDVTMTPKEPSLFATEVGTTHSGPWDYVQEIPIVLYGPGFVRSNGSVELGRESTIADVAPTVAELVGSPFPQDRPGQAITEALVPGRDTPKLVVVIVWDGGGWNVLDRWPKAWPFLKTLMQRGTSVTDAIVGSSPSVTPAVHSSLGTGAFPDQHGLVDIWLRNGKVTADSFEDMDPKNLLLPTVADLHDQALDNKPEIAMVAAEGWHLGMLGHGAALEGGDKDIAVMENEQVEPTTNPKFYSLPDYLADVPGLADDIRAVDAEDGAVDNRWLGHYVLAEAEDRVRSPVRSLEQTEQIKALIETEGFGSDDVPDLLFTNYKQIDLVGHSFNMVNPEMESVLEWSDRTLEDLVSFLDDTVGRREWAMVLTADHGQGPSPEATGGYPIDVLKLKSDVADILGKGEHRLFDRWRPTGYWLEPGLGFKNQKASNIADVIAAYRVGDAAGSDGLPDYYEGKASDRLFESAFPMARVDELLACTAKE